MACSARSTRCGAAADAHDAPTSEDSHTNGTQHVSRRHDGCGPRTRLRTAVRLVMIAVLLATCMPHVAAGSDQYIELTQVYPINASTFSDLHAGAAYRADDLQRFSKSPSIQSAIYGILYDFGSACNSADIEPLLANLTSTISMAAIALMNYDVGETGSTGDACVAVDTRISLIASHVGGVLLAWNNPDISKYGSSVPVLTCTVEIAGKIREINGTESVINYPWGLLVGFQTPEKAYNPWQYILIVVIALCTIAFLISVFLHFYLFKRRRQRRLVANQRATPAGGNEAPVFLSQSVVESFPITVYDKEEFKRRREEQRQRRRQAMSSKKNTSKLAKEETMVNDVDATENNGHDGLNNQFTSVNVNGGADFANSDVENGIIALDDAPLVAVKDVPTLELLYSTSSAETIGDENHNGVVNGTKNPLSADIEIKEESDVGGDVVASKRKSGQKKDIDARSIAFSIRTVEGGVTDDTCAICLGEYENGELLREIPCTHIFHKTCIDPWLQENSSVCPLCKTNIASFIDGSEEDEEEDDDGHIRVEDESHVNRHPFVGDQVEDGRATGYSPNRRSAAVSGGLDEIVMQPMSRAGETQRPYTSVDMASYQLTPPRYGDDSAQRDNLNEADIRRASVGGSISNFLRRVYHPSSNSSPGRGSRSVSSATTGGANTSVSGAMGQQAETSSTRYRSPQVRRSSQQSEQELESQNAAYASYWGNDSNNAQ